jgi:hypothetical protein
MNAKNRGRHPIPGIPLARYIYEFKTFASVIAQGIPVGVPPTLCHQWHRVVCA